jgi:hypothetical protein
LHGFRKSVQLLCSLSFQLDRRKYADRQSTLT